MLVQVAETLNARSALTNRILSAIVIPQIALILLGAAAVSAGVSKGLTPLRRLERALSKRSKLDLKPVETSNVPEEVYPLVIAINDLLDRLKKDIESQERFVANAAHQFRTPIAGLKTYVGLAERIIKDEKVSPIMSQLNSGCDRLTNLVNKMLSLAKVEPNFVTTNKTLLDLNEIASRATSDLVAEALEKEIDLTFKNSSDQALINGNETGLMDMVVNLVENAVHYTQKGGKVSVSVTANEAVTLLVEDNGPGIPIEERERVFERFYRILGNEASGSGLGLSIVKEIALAHNATITLEEGSAGGTLVRVTFERMKKGS
ncbi:MAG: Swarming motility regulation sensor protein RssA [bacterium ADurb.Bin425]|nr:MAG: Swarming motility regulation sensor protein RssA [bacterium ADurb.Bin425]